MLLSIIMLPSTTRNHFSERAWLCSKRTCREYEKLIKIFKTSLSKSHYTAIKIENNIDDATAVNSPWQSSSLKERRTLGVRTGAPAIAAMPRQTQLNRFSSPVIKCYKAPLMTDLLLHSSFPTSGIFKVNPDTSGAWS